MLSLGFSCLTIVKRVMTIVSATVLLVGPLSAQRNAIDIQHGLTGDGEPLDPALVQVPEDPIFHAY